MHDVPLCSLVHKGRHGVEARKQVGKPKTDTVQGRALKHQMFLVSHTVLIRECWGRIERISIEVLKQRSEACMWEYDLLPKQCVYNIQIHFSPKHGHLLNLLATPVTLCKGWQSGSNIQIKHQDECCEEMTAIQFTIDERHQAQPKAAPCREPRGQQHARRDMWQGYP